MTSIQTLISHHWYKTGFLVVALLAAVLLLYKLGEVPHGLSWDEAAIGYNGYATWTAHRDEWLARFPVSFRSFGDYKAPVAIYLSGLFTFLFGLNAFVVRLPFALIGIPASAIMMLLTRKILTNLLAQNS